MQKLHLVFILASLFSTSVFAADDQNMPMMADGKDCAMIAKECRSAGFSMGKKFWMECMKPVILGKAVKGVTVDATVVQACRAKKIERMKNELAEMESVK